MTTVYASTTYLGPGRTKIGDAIGYLQGLDLDGLEMGSTHLWQPEQDFIAAARTWAKETLVHNYCPPAQDDLILNIASLDKEIRAASIAHANKCISFAADIGAIGYTVHPGFRSEPTNATSAKTDGAYDFNFSDIEADYDTAFGLMIDALKELAASAEEAGILLAIETEGSVTKQGVLLMERPEEYDLLFKEIPAGVGINANIAHMMLASVVHGHSVEGFLEKFRSRIIAVELSHTDVHQDLHQSLKPDSPPLRFLDRIPDVPIVLEFRDATPDDIARSIDIVRSRLA